MKTIPVTVRGVKARIDGERTAAVLRAALVGSGLVMKATKRDGIVISLKAKESK